MADVKSAFWSFLVYPEWYDNLECDYDHVIKYSLSDLQIPGFLSPEHNQDLNSDGSLKKSHYHVYLKWSGPTTYSNALKTIQSRFPNVKTCMPMSSIQGSWDYSWHAEHTDKFTYNPKDIYIFNGFDIDREVKYNFSDEERYITEILEFCESKKCYEFSHLILYSRLNNLDWYKVIRANTYFFKVFMDSWRNGGSQSIDYLYE